MKTITIRDSTYENLRRMKEPDMSFSDAIDLLLRSRSVGLERRFGALAGSTALDEIEAFTEATRRTARFRV
ncbi:antitoxin [Methanoculleus sp. FWC-SCC1]|uniref:Antitoxin n=1 Tax=Methanoculleus frigidifontis TaxID=2584085 RepID=A0ABT8MCN2_9EURY|nr:antitoxin VapB family protein [Methanoculleus sp. FWC-SCC1]MDN7025690.1 antitoxin [Methanoculleus sp. FWC-SCC1]